MRNATLLLTLLASAVTTSLAATPTVNPALVSVAPHAPARVSITLVNHDRQFRDVAIDGHTYTVDPHRILLVTAPEGTTIFAASTAHNFHRGDVVVQLSASANNQNIDLK